MIETSFKRTAFNIKVFSYYIMTTYTVRGNPTEGATSYIADRLGQEGYIFGFPIELWHELSPLFVKAEAMPKKLHRYMLTFTLKQDYDDATIEKIEKWIRRNACNPLLNPVKGEFYIAKEHTQQGRVHWHVKATYENFVKKSNFRHYSDTWGFVDVSKTRGEKGEKTLGYLQKEDEPQLFY